MQNPMLPAGIETATLRFVAQHLNHCAIAVPIEKSANKNKRSSNLTFYNGIYWEYLRRVINDLRTRTDVVQAIILVPQLTNRLQRHYAAVKLFDVGPR